MIGKVDIGKIGIGKASVGKLLYGLTGIALGLATAVTADYGLKKENSKLYEEALGLQAGVDELGFPDFRLADLKVRFYDGNSDYVVTADQSGRKIGQIVKDKPVFTTFVGTTYEVDGEYQVILPTLENFSQFYSLMGTAQTLSEGSLSFEEEGYGAWEHEATLWHEAFHTWQMTYYYDNVIGLTQEEEFPDGMEKVIVEDVDSEENVVKSFKEGTELLIQAYQATDREEKLSLIDSYLRMEEKRRQQLDTQACVAEDYLETMEGTARYIESAVYGLLYGKEAMETYYIVRPADRGYEKGSGKYYTTGMLKCYLMSQLDENWNMGYGFDRSLNALFTEVCR